MSNLSDWFEGTEFTLINDTVAVVHMNNTAFSITTLAYVLKDSKSAKMM